MAIEFYSSIDLNQNELQHPRLQHSGSNPTSPSPLSGQLYYNSGDNTVRFYDGSNWQTLSTTTGDITGVTAGDGLTGGGSSGAVTLNVVGGDGITANANDVAITAAQTTITSVLNTALVVGRDADNQIKFGTDNTMVFRVGAGDGVTFKASGEIEATSLDISGDADIDGTLETDALTIGGTNILTGGIVTSLGTIAQDTVTFTSANANDPNVVIKNTANDANGARLTFTKDKGAAGADNDEIGEIIFVGDDGAQTQTEFGAIRILIAEADDTDEAGAMRLSVASSDGTDTGLTDGLTLTGHKSGDYVDVTLGAGSDSTTTVAGDLQVDGDLTVSGTNTILDSTTIATGDSFIKLAKDQGTSSDAVDFGFYGKYGESGTAKYAGLFRDAGATDEPFTFFEGTQLEPGTTLNPSGTGYALAAVKASKVIAGSLDISGDVDVDGTLETDALTINGSAVLAQATTSAVGAVELATSAETQTGTDTARAVTPDGLAARSVVADIVVASLTDANIVTITHNLGTADIMVQVYDKTTEANIMCDIARTTDDFSTASTSVVSIDFGTAPPNDCRALITSLKGATASGTVAYT